MDMISGKRNGDSTKATINHKITELGRKKLRVTTSVRC